MAVYDAGNEETINTLNVQLFSGPNNELIIICTKNCLTFIFDTVKEVKIVCGTNYKLGVFVA